MKVKVNELNGLLKKVTPAVAKTGVLMVQALPGKLMLQASDGSCAASSVIACETDKPETFFVMYSVLNSAVSELLKLACDTEDVELVIGNALAVSRGDARVDLPLSLKEEFKPIVPPAKTEPCVKAVLDGHWCRKALYSAARATDEKAVGMRGNVYVRLLPDSFESGGTDGYKMSIVTQGAYKEPVDIETYVDFALTAQRTRELTNVLDDESDVTVQIYDKCVMFAYGATMVVVPKAENDGAWSFHDKLVQTISNAAEGGTTLEIDRKAFLSALSLISCNLSKNENDTWKVSLECKKDVLVISNVLGTASNEVPAVMDGSFEGRALFSILLLKEVLSGLEGDNAFITINGSQDSPILHFEENTERIVVLGFKK